MRKSPEEVHAILKERFGEAILAEQLGAPDPFVIVRPDVVEEVARFVRDDDRLRMDLLTAIVGVDYPAGAPGAVASAPPSQAAAGAPDRAVIEVIYCVESTRDGSSLIFKAALPRENPRVASVERVWRTADWHERETYDLLGVIFEGHHNLVRILCAEDWEGHPLRKDYVIPETYRGLKNVVY